MEHAEQKGTRTRTKQHALRSFPLLWDPGFRARDGQAPTEDVQPDLKAKRAALDSRKLSCNRTDPGPLKKNGF